MWVRNLFPSVRDPDDCLRRCSIVMRLVAMLPIIWELPMDQINNQNEEKIHSYCNIHSLVNTSALTI